MSYRFLFPPLPTTPAERFSTLINMLIQAVIGRTGAGGLDFWMVQAITRRITRLNAEIRELVAALRAGTLRVRRSPAAGLTRRPGSVPALDGTALLLPRRFGWLLPLVPGDAAMAGHNFRLLLEEPEMAALLAASPRLVRSVRSLCWMLGAKAPVPEMPEVPAPPPAAGPEGDAPRRGGASHADAAPRAKPAPQVGRRAPRAKLARWGVGDARLRS